MMVMGANFVPSLHLLHVCMCSVYPSVSRKRVWLDLQISAARAACQRPH